MPTSDISIINSVFGILSADSVFLGHLGLTTDSTMAQKVAKIQKEMEPNGLTTTNVPLVCIYPIVGVRSKANGIVYDAMFEVTIYSDNSSGAKSATTKAGTMVIGDRAQTLLHYVQLAGQTIKTEFQASFQSASGVAGIKKYTLRFKVGQVIG